MRAVNLENVQEAGDFERLEAGGYVCKITNVEDVPVNNQTGKGDYLKIEYDIAEGEHAGFYKRLEESMQFWGGRYIRSYKEKALPMFKRMCSAISKSNPGFVFDGGQQNSNEQTLVGKKVGLILGKEEYEGNDGSLKTRLYVKSECDIADIRAGKFKVPELKHLDGTSGAKTTDDGFMSIQDNDEEELPFN